MGRLAMGQVIAAGILPILLVLAAGFGIERISSTFQAHWGHVIEPASVMIARAVFLAAAGVGMTVMTALSWRAWRKASDFEGAAEQIDTRLGARQEILTLATLADPRREKSKERRSPLFAMLWRRTITYLEKFNPEREFRFDPASALKDASIWFGALVLVVAVVIFSLVRAQTPVEAAASAIRQLANTEQKGSSPENNERAAAARAVANDLENPRLPPEQKLAELQSLKQQLIKSAQKTGTRSGSASGNSSGNGNASGKGTGAGSGGENAAGSGVGGAGSGKNGQGNGTGQSQPGENRDKQSVELQNKLAKAEAKLEEESKTTDKSQLAQKPGPDNKETAPQAGNNPNQTGPGAKPNGMGDQQVPEPGKLAQNQSQGPTNGASTHKNDNGSQGDTHLGDFPKAANYDRYYKLGEKGPALDIRDARYVTFRIPPVTVVKGGAGNLTPDSSAPSATTPYTNAPLKQQRLAAAPDEEQLIPPRYRDLIK